MEENCVKRERNSDISLAILIFGATTVIVYLFIFSFAETILSNKKQIDYIWILIASLLFAVIFTGVIFLIKYVMYPKKE